MNPKGLINTTRYIAKIISFSNSTGDKSKKIVLAHQEILFSEFADNFIIEGIMSSKDEVEISNLKTKKMILDLCKYFGINQIVDEIYINKGETLIEGLFSGIKLSQHSYIEKIRTSFPPDLSAYIIDRYENFNLHIHKGDEKAAELNRIVDRIKKCSNDDYEEIIKLSIEALEYLDGEEFDRTFFDVDEYISTFFDKHKESLEEHNTVLEIIDYKEKILALYEVKMSDDQLVSVYISLGDLYKYLNQFSEDDFGEKGIIYSKQAVDLYKKFTLNKNEQTDPIIGSVCREVGWYYLNQIISNKSTQLTNLDVARYYFETAFDYLSEEDTEIKIFLYIDLATVYETQSIMVEDRSFLEKAFESIKFAKETINSNVSKETVDAVDKMLYSVSLQLEHFDEAIKKINDLSSPSLEESINLAQKYFDEEDWANACSVFKHVFMLHARALPNLVPDQEIMFAAEYSKICDKYAYCLFKKGKYEDGLIVLEEGKNILMKGKFFHSLLLDYHNKNFDEREEYVGISILVQEILSAEAKWRASGIPISSSSEDDVTWFAKKEFYYSKYRQKYLEEIELTIDEILSMVPKGSVAIIPLVTIKGTVVTVIPAGLKKLSSKYLIWLEEFTSADIENITIGSNGWVSAYKAYNTEKTPLNFSFWMDSINKSSQVLWEKLIKQVYSKFRDIGINYDYDALFFPHGGLGDLPIHIASGTFAGEEHFLLKDFNFSISPSFYSYNLSRKNLEEPYFKDRDFGNNLFAVIDPNKDLEYAVYEYSMINGHFDEATYLAGDSATSENLTSPAIPAKLYNYFHFSGHGYYDEKDIFRSGLVLADGNFSLNQILWPGQFASMKPRLAVLSGCDTGISEIQQVPNESLGLPSGFLELGYPGVVGSLWGIDDAATSIFMRVFYSYHITEKLAPAVALRKAQLWFANVTHKELVSKYGALYPNYENSEIDEMFRPYHDKFYWASFRYFGV